MTVYPSKILVFFLGFVVGVIIALIYNVGIIKLESSKSFTFKNNIASNNLIKDLGSYEQWMKLEGYSKYPLDFDYYSYSGNKSLINNLESQLLKAKVSILCVMFINNVNNAYSAINTWMKNCNDYKFYSKKPAKYLEVTLINPKNAWHYLCEVIRHIDNNAEDYMWVLFVPDNVFAIPENLRRYVLNAKFEEQFYLGHSAFFWNTHYNIGQAGFVLSKGSIKSLVNKFSSSNSCVRSGKYWKNEDFYLGKYLSELGVKLTDTRDEFGRGRFHLFTPVQLMAPENDEVLNKYWKTSLYTVSQGFNCCSPQSITFQGTQGTLIYFYNYLLYNLHLYKHPGKLGNAKSNVYFPSDKVWKQFVMDELGSQVNLSAITSQKYYKMWSDKIDSPSMFNKRLKELFFGKSWN